MFHSDGTTWRLLCPKPWAMTSDLLWDMQPVPLQDKKSLDRVSLAWTCTEDSPGKAYLSYTVPTAMTWRIPPAPHFRGCFITNFCLVQLLLSPSDINFTAISKKQARPSWNTSWLLAPLHSKASMFFFFPEELRICEKLETDVWNYVNLLKSCNWVKGLNPHTVCSLTFYVTFVFRIIFVFAKKLSTEKKHSFRHILLLTTHYTTLRQVFLLKF